MSRLAALVVGQIVDRLARQGDQAGSDRLRLAAEEIVGDRLPMGCTPVPTDAWRRIWALLPDDVRNADSGLSGAELVATWLEGRLRETDLYTPVLTATWGRVLTSLGLVEDASHPAVAEATESLGDALYNEQQDVFSLQSRLHALQSELAKALGVEGDPQAHDLVAAVRDRVSDLRDVEEFNADFRAQLRSIEVAVGGWLPVPYLRHDVVATVERLANETDARHAENSRLRSERDRYRAAIVRTIGDVSPDDTPEGMGEELRLRFARLNAELDAMAQRALMPDAPSDPTQAGEAARIEEAFEGYRVEMTASPDLAVSPVVTQEGDGFGVSVPEGGSVTIERESPPAVLYGNPPVPDDYPGRGKEPLRVSLAPVGPKVPTLDDRIEAIRRLSQGESKADVASFLGLKSAVTVHGMTLHDKSRIQRLKEAAPHDKDAVLASIRKELEQKAVPSAS